MQLTTLPLVAALAGLAAAVTGNVYTHDPNTVAATTERRTLSPNTARLVVAQRVGVEEYHVDGTLSEKEIEAINTYGSKTPLFGQDARIHKAFLLLIGETESDAIAKLSSSFAISTAPSAPSTKDLFNDLLQQVDPKAALSSSTHDWIAANTRDDNFYSTASLATKDDDYFFFTSSLAELETRFAQLHEEGTSSITALLVPNKTTASSQWGTYSMPFSQSPLKKQRAKRQLGSEEPLSAPTTHSTVPVSSLNDEDASIFANNSTPLPGILPACFRSQSECESSTRNCTGHGACSLKYTNKDAARGAKGECYSCSCSATVVKSEDGKTKTTVWGGPACQKKDVSVQFWLLALFTVALVFLVSFAVGTVYTMGSEELPSVIGAGVSGPVRK